MILGLEGGGVTMGTTVRRGSYDSELLAPSLTHVQCTKTHILTQKCTSRQRPDDDHSKKKTTRPLLVKVAVLKLKVRALLRVYSTGKTSILSRQQ